MSFHTYVAVGKTSVIIDDERVTWRAANLKCFAGMITSLSRYAVCVVAYAVGVYLTIKDAIIKGSLLRSVANCGCFTTVVKRPSELLFGCLTMHPRDGIRPMTPRGQSPII